MRKSEIKNLSVEELENLLVENRASLRSLKFSHAVAPIENPMAIRAKRRLVASLITELTVKKAAQSQNA